MPESDVTRAGRALPLLVAVLVLIGCAAQSTPEATTAATITQPPATDTATAPNTTRVGAPIPREEATIPTETATITATVPPTVTFTPPDPSSLPVSLYDEQLDPWDRGVTSVDGRYTLTTGSPEDFGTPSANSTINVYLRDNTDGSERIVSINEDGEPGNFWNTPAALSADGSTAAFWSYSTNLVDLGNDCEHAGAMNTGCEIGHVYVANVFTGELQHIEVGAGYGLGMVSDIDLSADGRFLAFANNGAVTRPGAWLLDRATGEFTQISPAGLAVDLTDDGSLLAYVADDENVTWDGNMSEDVFLYDVATGERTWVSEPPTGAIPYADHPSGFVYFSEGGGGDFEMTPDGRFITFSSIQVGLADAPFTPCETETFPLEKPVCQHVYMYDVDSGALELISTSSEGIPGNQPSFGSAISPDGRFVAFYSAADNLTLEGRIPCVDNAPQYCMALYLKDRQTGRTYLLNRAWTGSPSNRTAWLGGFSANSRSVIFYSAASDILPDLPEQASTMRTDAFRGFIVDIYRLIGEE